MIVIALAHAADCGEVRTTLREQMRQCMSMHDQVVAPPDTKLPCEEKVRTFIYYIMV